MDRVTYRTVYPLAAIRGRRPSVDDKRSAEKDRKDAAIRATALNGDPQLIHDSHTYVEHQRIALRLPLKSRARFRWEIKPGGKHGETVCYREARFSPNVALRLPTTHHHHRQGKCCRKDHSLEPVAPRQMTAAQACTNCSKSRRTKIGTLCRACRIALERREAESARPLPSGILAETLWNESKLVPDGQGGHIWQKPNS